MCTAVDVPASIVGLEHRAVLSATAGLSLFTPVVTPVLSFIDAMVNDGRSAHDSRSTGDRCSDDATAGTSSWS